MIDRRDNPLRPNREVLDAQTPSKISHQKVKLAAVELRGLQRQYRAAEGDLRRLQDARATAESLDRAAYADALRAGQPDPGSKALVAANAAIAEGARRLEALGQAVEGSYADLVAAVEKGEQAWRASLEKDLAARREDLRAAIEQVERAHSALADTLATRGWLAVFADGRPARYKPGAFVGALAGIRGPSGDALPVSTAFAALRELAAEPEPTNPPAEPVALRPAA